MFKRLIFSVVAFVSAASAQIPEDGLGPYKFGASLSDVKATAATAEWKVEKSPQSAFTEILTGGPRLVLAGARLTAGLTFENDKLTIIGLFGDAASTCGEAIPNLVTALEPDFGIFDSAPGPLEPRPIPTVSTTHDGSELRAYAPQDGPAAIYSTHRGGMLVEIRGTSTSTAGCDVRIVFQRATPYAGPPASATQEEIDRAKTINSSARWSKTPTGRSFDRALPRSAIDKKLSGAVILNCIVRPDGRLGCLVSAEAPAGAGFGVAGLDVARDFQIQVKGTDIVGKRIRVPIRFNIR